MVATKKSADSNGFLMYKGKPLVRSGDTLYYGNMYDKYVIMMKIQENGKINDVDAASSVQVQLLSTDEDMRARDRVIKKTEKEGLYNAIDIGSIWLERALGEL